jgi:hypothetical protein
MAMMIMMMMMMMINQLSTHSAASFFTGSSIASTSVLSRRRNAHPFVFIRSNFITGVDLKALFTIDPLSYRTTANSTAYNTLTTFQSVLLYHIHACILQLITSYTYS